MYYLRARYYNPYTGRFITEDSYKGEDNNPLSLNLYTYCYNDPIQFVDPTGHYVVCPDESSDSGSYYNDSDDDQSKPALTRGAKGDDVAELQEKLIDEGYDLGSWGADGSYGPATERAVKQYQEDHNLTVDGMTGNEAWGSLLDEDDSSSSSSSDPYERYIDNKYEEINEGLDGTETVNNDNSSGQESNNTTNNSSNNSSDPYERYVNRKNEEISEGVDETETVNYNSSSGQESQQGEVLNGDVVYDDGRDDVVTDNYSSNGSNNGNSGITEMTDEDKYINKLITSGFAVVETTPYYGEAEFDAYEIMNAEVMAKICGISEDDIRYDDFIAANIYLDRVSNMIAQTSGLSLYVTTQSYNSYSYYKGMSNRNFASVEKLDSHFAKHGKEFKGVYKNADEYLQGARDVMQNGTKVSYSYKGETRIGYVKFMGNSSKKGIAKFEFVGTNNLGDITTYHVESGKTFWKMLNGKNIKVINPID
ncbi:MAG: hypothetical protein FH761_11375 [Firmicutes bacterium]|nr:hypothetical protein [Bacillota bacterium]